MDKAEVWDWGSVDRLEKEGGGVYRVEGHAIGSRVVTMVSFRVSGIRCSTFMSKAGDDVARVGRQKRENGHFTVSQLPMRPS